jgi:hypothetical protein
MSVPHNRVVIVSFSELSYNFPLKTVCKDIAPVGYAPTQWGHEDRATRIQINMVVYFGM